MPPLSGSHLASPSRRSLDGPPLRSGPSTLSHSVRACAGASPSWTAHLPSNSVSRFKLTAGHTPLKTMAAAVAPCGAPRLYPMSVAPCAPPVTCVRPVLAGRARGICLETTAAAQLIDRPSDSFVLIFVFIPNGVGMKMKTKIKNLVPWFDESTSEHTRRWVSHPAYPAVRALAPVHTTDAIFGVIRHPRRLALDVIRCVFVAIVSVWLASILYGFSIPIPDEIGIFFFGYILDEWYSLRDLIIGK